MVWARCGMGAVWYGCMFVGVCVLCGMVCVYCERRFYCPKQTKAATEGQRSTVRWYVWCGMVHVLW